MKRLIVSLFLVCVAISIRLEAHAFLKAATPAVGSTIQTSPGEVRISFTEKIEPAFGMIQVFDASGKQVDKRDAHVSYSDQSTVAISLPPLQAGTYKVVWRVVSIDTHVTKGSFKFQIAR
jgi:methionine-rich copper-binding protein CopC